MKTLVLFLTVALISSCSSGTEPVKNTPVATLGEGAIWHPEKEALMWVDITEGRVFMYKPGEGMLQNFDLESMVGTVVPAEKDYLAVVFHIVLRVMDLFSRMKK